MTTAQGGSNRRLRIGKATVEGELSDELREVLGYEVHWVSDGSLTIDETSYDRIPIPLEATGAIQVVLEFWAYRVAVRGCSAKLELFGEPEFVEENSKARLPLH